MLFEKYIKNKLENYTSPVSEEVWNKIVAEQEKRKTIFFWSKNTFHILVGVFIIVGLIGFFTLLQFQQQATTNLTYANNNLPNKKVIDVSKTTLSTFDDDKNINTSINNSTSSTQISKATSQKQYQKIKTTQQNNYPSKTLDNTLVNISNNNTTSEQITEQDENNFYTNNASTVLVKPTITPLLFKQLSEVNTAPKTIINKKKKLLFVNNPIDCPGESSSYKKNWYVETYLAPEYVFKKVTAINPNSAFMQRKDSSEKMVMGITFGAKVTKGLSNNLYIKAGLQYAHLIEKMTSIYESERKEITIITIRTETDINGNSVTVSDTSKQIQISYANKVNYNVYKNLELPITLGYEVYNRGFKASVNGGVIINLASSYQGKILDTSMQLINAKDNAGFYKHTVGLSLLGSVSLIKPLSDNFDVFAEPYFRYNLSQPKYNAYGYSQKFSAVGVNFGVRFKLNHKSRLSLNN